MIQTLQANLPQEDSVRQEQVAKKQKEYHLIGQQRKTPGHTLFEFNKKTKELKLAQVTRRALWGFEGSAKFETRTDVHEDCFYLQALNKRNAEKKLRKLGMI